MSAQGWAAVFERPAPGIARLFAQRCEACGGTCRPGEHRAEPVDPAAAVRIALAQPQDSETGWSR